MLKVMVNGCNGKMGQVVCNLVSKDNELNMVCGFDKNLEINNSFPVYDRLENINQKYYLKS